MKTKKESKKAESKKTISKSKDSGVTYIITCDGKGAIKSIVPTQKK